MSYIFVGGSQRSGTSIAQQILCQHPDANPYVFESSFLRQLVCCYSEARSNFNNNHKSYFGDLQGLRNFNCGVVQAFLEQVNVRLGNHSHLILKEPHLTLVWPHLYELVPQAQFLMIVRDPRDVIASMVQVGARQKAAGQYYEFVNRDMPRLCRHFLSFYEPSFSVQDENFKNQLAVVHYEELVNDPKQMLQEIASFTGISFDQIDTEQTPDTGHVQPQTTTSALYSPWVTEVSGQKLSKGRVGNYLNVLTPSEVAQVEEHCSEFFEWFGYSRQAA
ncbi:MAG: sulfotransferase [Fuerstiella sp.]|nr:sulfotransferase [Fuerstiella sp.]MDG2127554.1 sulfotransferase [Fuerstiella sp.]